MINNKTPGDDHYEYAEGEDKEDEFKEEETDEESLNNYNEKE